MEALKAVWSRFWMAITSTKYQVMIAGTIAFFTGQMDQWGWLALAGWFTGMNILQKKIQSPNGSEAELADQGTSIQTSGQSQYVDSSTNDEAQNPAAGAQGYENKSVGFRIKA